MQKLFGPIMQNAFVVDDLDAALHHWTTSMGAGPFYVFEHVQFHELYFRGKVSPVDITAAIAYWGDVQIEFIEQHNDAPSIYREFKERGLQGMQHMGVLTADLDEQLSRLKPLGMTPVQWGSMPSGMRFAYVNSDFHPGAMIELIETAPALMETFEQLQDAAARWDGTDGIIRLKS